MTPDPIEEAVARAIHEARFAHPEHPREPEPWDKGDREYAFRLTRRALAALEAAGLVIVPAEPTEAMLEAGSNRWETHHPGLNETYPNERATYRAMISAVRKGEHDHGPD